MESKHRDIFRRSILSSAILASLYSVSSVSLAASCPNPDASNNIEVPAGTTCTGGIEPDEAVDTVTIEGTVEGNVVNRNGLSRLIVDGGTVDGSIHHEAANNSGTGIVKGAVVTGGLTNGVNGVINSSIEIVDQVTIEGGIENQGEISFKSNHISEYADYIPEAALEEGTEFQGANLGAIRVDHQTTIQGDIINSGVIDIYIPEQEVDQPPPEPYPIEGVYLPNLEDEANEEYLVFPQSLSGITVSNGSTAGNVINRSDISVHAGIAETDHPFFVDTFPVNGITVNEHSTVSSIQNEGNISADNSGIYVEGNNTEDSTLVLGSVVNAENALISSKNHGIYIDTARVQGSVINSGEIETSFLSYVQSDGIHLNDALVEGDVKNDGTINAQNEGMLIDGGTVKGSFINEGDITARSDGMFLRGGGVVEQDLVSSGTIKAIRHDGIDINDSTVKGSVLLSGSIEAGDNAIEIDGGFFDGDEEEGFVYASIGGDLNNRASLTSVTVEEDEVNDASDGGDGFDMDHVKVGGSLINSGEINVTKKGFDLESITIGGDFINAAAITSGEEGIRLRKNSSDDDIESEFPEGTVLPIEIGGNFENSGNINSGSSGIDIEETTIGGNFQNSSDITAGSSSAIIIKASDINGSFINQGNLTANAVVIQEEGDLPVKQRGISLISNLYEDDGSLEVERQLVIRESLFNSGNINANDEGIYIDNAVIGGVFDNSGNIQSGQQGITLNQTEVGSGFVNSGNIDAGDDGVLIDNSSVSLIVNSGAITAGTTSEESSYGNGIKVYKGTGGEIRNTETGTITSVDDGIEVEIASGDTSINNAGVITAGDDGLDLQDVTGNITLGNSGTISATSDTIEIYDTIGNISLVNTDSLKAENDSGSSDTLDFGNIEGNVTITNSGTMTARGTSGGVDSLDIGNVDGDLQVSNSGTIESVSTEGNGGNDALDLYDISGNVAIVNSSQINANTNGDGNDALDIGGIGGNLEIVNSGTINANGDGESNNALDIGNISGNLVILNEGTMSSSGEGDGNHTIDITAATGGITFTNTGTLSGATTFSVKESSGAAVISNNNTVNGSLYAFELFNSNFTGDLSNSGSITSGDDGIRLVDSTLAASSKHNGSVVNSADGTINSGDDAIRLLSSTLGGTLENHGTINASENAIDIDAGVVTGSLINSGSLSSVNETLSIGLDTSGNVYDGDESSIAGVINSGSMVASAGAVITVGNGNVGKITNYGVITGGQYVVPEDSADLSEGMRALDTRRNVAIDYRKATSALDLFSGQSGNNTGSINGDIYGSSLESDQFELAAGQFSSYVYDVEAVNITGLVNLNSHVLSTGNNTRLTVTDSGTLSMTTGNQVKLEGNYSQNGDMALVLNRNNGEFTNPLVDASNSADVIADSVLRISVENRNLNNFNPGNGSQEIHLVHAGTGITDNGLSIQKDSIIFSYEKFKRTAPEGGTKEQLGLIASINNLGELASEGGADNNAANALSSLQGTDSSGLVALQASNPDLFNAIYDGTTASLALLAETLIASPDSGIAASQNAQSEALSTILSRIAELRTGASGISAGDAEESRGIRPDSLWLRAIHSEGQQDEIRSSGNRYNGYSLRSTGFTLGLDKDVTDNLTLGAGVTHATSRANEKGSSQSSAKSYTNSETDSYLVSAYAGWKNLTYFADTTISYGKSKTDLTGPGWETDYDSDQIGLSVLAGRSFLMNDNDTLVEPQVGFNYARISTDGYRYQSNGEQVSVGKQNLEAIELGVGLRYKTSFELGNNTLLPEINLMAWHDLNAESVEADVKFETSNNSFTYFGSKGVRNRYQAGIGAEYWMDNNVTLSANYDHNWQSGFKADTWIVKVRYDF
ncbi:autotransporter domain-containing protein [Endozoicomonas euniceicola]|uniref:Autotransporter domain-containing protein n=1 Tax=Endozoicomonas euniceicola TaxID=1234143 RepID=A0ABY6H048_9GAMM|nr:autotransporter domain-containing protein [Endozoicomonas euniceicola]UYM18417.1 autotransporter domain-containing protein [Endozoicomonas euniceicola]